MGGRGSLQTPGSGPFGGAVTDQELVALDSAVFDRKDWLITDGLTNPIAPAARQIQLEEQTETPDAGQRAAPAVSQPIQEALDALAEFSDRAGITHYPVDNPERLVVVMTEAHLGGLTPEQLEIIGLDAKKAGELNAKQRDLLLDLVRSLGVDTLYPDGMTPEKAESISQDLQMLRVFLVYDRALKNPDLPQAQRERLPELDRRYRLEEHRAELEQYARWVQDKPALVAAFNLRLNLGGLEPAAELEAMLTAVAENPRLRAEDPEMAALILARDEKIIARLPQVSDAQVDLLYYGDGHFSEDTIRAMNEQGMYVVRLTESGVLDYFYPNR